MALSIAITRVVPLYPNGTFFQWDLLSLTEVGSYLFNVYRGGSSSGPWTTLATALVDSYNYIDTLPVTYTDGEKAPNQLSTMRGLHYRVISTAPSGAQVEAISTVEPKLEGRFKLLKRKILRDEALLLRKLNGVEVAVCKRRHWGVKCTKCYDKYTNEVVRGNCTNCFGTGYVGGYHSPLITLARRGVAAPQTQLTPQGKSDTSVVSVTLLDLPLVEEEDVLVFLRDNRRFVVKNVQPTEIQTVTVHQKLMVSELARSSIEYRIPVDPLRVPPLF